MKELDLGKDEKVIGQYDLSYSALFSFAKSNFDITNKRLIVNIPHTFGIIPIGKNSSTYPLNNISRVRIERKIRIKMLLIGTVVALFTLEDFRHLFLLSLIGLAIVITAVETTISIQNNAGKDIRFSISPLERGRARNLIDKLNKAIVDCI